MRGKTPPKWLNGSRRLLSRRRGTGRFIPTRFSAEEAITGSNPPGAETPEESDVHSPVDREERRNCVAGMMPDGHLDAARAGVFLRRWSFLSGAILLAVAVSGDSIETAPSISAGVTVTKAVPFSRETLSEASALAPFRAGGSHGNRAIHIHRVPRRSTANGGELATLAPAARVPASSPLSSSPSAPAADSSFPGLSNPPPTEGDVVPPDTMGAVGPAHIVSLLNSDFGVFDKATGAEIQKIPLGSFWAALGTAAGQPADFPFDTKVLYDTATGRFFAVTLGGTSSPNSWILIAVSAGSDPTGSWFKWAIDADRDNDVQAFNNWADFPGVGLDANNLYISANMFSNAVISQYSKIWVLPKAQLLSGSATITWTEFRNPPGSDFNMQPAHTFGPAPGEYFVYEGSANHLSVARIVTVAGVPVWQAPVSVPVNSYVSTNSLPGAPQPADNNTIDTSDTRILNAVYRAGFLWTVHTVESPSGGKTEVAWYQIDPAARAVTSQGRISDPLRWYYYPSIGVNANGDVAVGMSGSSVTEFAGAYYTARRFADPAGTMQEVSLLKAGEQLYFKTLSGSSNRWGDYSATVADPSGNLRFWTVQEYAKTHDPQGVSRWGTWWGSFFLAPLSAPSDPGNLEAAPLSESTVSLAWTDTSSNEESFVIERKTGGGAFSIITLEATNDVAGFTDKGLQERTAYSYRVKARNSIGDSGYSNERSVTTLLATPAGVSAVATSSTSVDIAWTDRSALETGYRLERKAGAGGEYSVIATLAADADHFTDNTVSAGKVYYYRVQAFDNVTPAQSAYSEEVPATTPGSATVGGGGGGGCLTVSGSQGDPGSTGGPFSFGVLLLPSGAIAVRRLLRRATRPLPFRHPVC